MENIPSSPAPKPPKSTHKGLKIALLALVAIFVLIIIAAANSDPKPAVKEAKQSEQTAQSTLPQTASSTDQQVKSAEEQTQPIQQQTVGAEEKTYLVVKVVDGDTIELDNGMKVRYIGIDTPETVHPSKPVQCFGKEASNKNKELVLNKRVRLEKDVSDTDRYGRWLRFVYVGDVFVNDYMVRNGYAYAYRYAPDVKLADQFLQAQQEARENGRGLWAAGCETNQPTVTPTPSPATASQPSGHTFYLSSYRTATLYYCDTDEGWKTLKPEYLKTYTSETELLKDYPGRSLHEPCK